MPYKSLSKYSQGRYSEAQALLLKELQFMKKIEFGFGYRVFVTAG